MNFLRTFASSLNFLSYERLSEARIKDTFKYLAKLVLVFFIIFCLLMIPRIVKLSGTLDKEIGKFSTFQLNTNLTQKEPIVLYGRDSRMMVTIDSTSNATTVAKGKYLITSDNVVKKSWLGTEVTSIEGYSDVLKHKEFYKKLAFILVGLALPGIILFGYVGYLIKYIILSLIVSFFILIFSRLLRYEVSYKQIFNSTVYGMTIAVILEAVLKPFIHIPYIGVSGVALIAGIIWASVGVSRIGFFERKKGGGQKTRKRGYIELE